MSWAGRCGRVIRRRRSSQRFSEFCPSRG
ncbi:zinc finger domain-containing protein [Azospirillum sp. A23]